MAVPETTSIAILAAQRAMAAKSSNKNKERRDDPKKRGAEPQKPFDANLIDTKAQKSKQKRVSNGKSSLFLQLPQSIRFQIYRYIADISEGWVNLDGGKELLSHPVISLYGKTTAVAKKRARDALFRNLSRVCRVTYEDISRIAYSENFFHIGCFPYSKDSKPLIALRKLRPSSVSLLNYLVIHLNPYTSQTTPHPLLTCYHQTHSNQLHQMHYSWQKIHWDLEKIDDKDEILVEKWILAAQYLAAHITPYSLTLRFICDIEKHSIAQKALAPFRHNLKLKSCSIRLSWAPMPLYKSLTRQASLHAMGIEERDQQSQEQAKPTQVSPSLVVEQSEIRPRKSLLDLPKELRLLILTFSDLVTPLKEVYWTAPRKFHLYYPSPGHGFSDKERNISKVCRHESCKFRICQPSIYSGCFCRRWHGSYSPDCHCWEPPKALFLVCKDLWRDATEIFYRNNRFVITPWKLYTTLNVEKYRLDIDVYLRNFVPNEALRYINYLQVAFLPLDKLQIRPSTPIYESWLQTIDFMSQHMSIQNLTLEACPWTLVDTVYENSTAAFSSEDVELYNTAFQPLQRLNGLKNFTLHVALPGKSIYEYARKVKDDIERIVLGSRYDNCKIESTKRSEMVGLRRLGKPA